MLVPQQVLHRTQTDPDAKFLIFSQYEPMLEIVYQALRDNNIRVVSSTGGAKQKSQTIAAFQSGNDVQAVLMSLRSENSGLTLTAATDVCILEPAIEANHELQAIARVHRLGQRRPTHAYRFVMMDTVEAELHAQHQAAAGGVHIDGEADRHSLAVRAEREQALKQEELLRLLGFYNDNDA
jgi:E3 ubiquitin-protein ligase SHPRH